MSGVYDDVITLEGLEAVRKRPGMYVGSTNSIDGENPRALLQLAQEILSNSTDEALAGYGDEICITLHKDNSLTVEDKGRGIPMGVDGDSIIRSFTVLHTSGKFDDSTYQISGGQHGIGSKAANALSKRLSVEAVTSVGDAYRIEFEQENVISFKSRKRKKDEETGTIVHFMPDDAIFDMTEWDANALKNKLQTLAYLSDGVTYKFINERDDVEEDDDGVTTYRYDEGIADLVASVSDKSERIGFKAPLRIRKKVTIDDNKQPVRVINHDEETDEKTMRVDLAILYTESIGEQIFSFVNAIPTREGGPHEQGAKDAIRDAFRQFIADKHILKNDNVDPKDTRDGLVLGISLGITEDMLQFESQTKEKLGTTQAKKAVKMVLEESLSLWLYDHEKEAKKIIEKMVDAKSAREASKEARKVSKEARKGKKGREKLLLSTKLTKANSNNPKERELFVVEGDSAGGSAKSARSPKTQAILPLRGKPLNVSNKRLSGVMKNEEIATLVNVIGAGIGIDFDITAIQYDKVIIMADADDDGFHIMELLILAMWKLMPDLLRHGHVYVANAPLYRFDRYVNGTREKAFAIDSVEYEQMKAQHKGWKVTRLKGLGEMNPSELEETTMKKGTRRLTQLKVENEQDLTRMLELFLGSKPKDGMSASAARRKWLSDNVDFVVSP